MKAQPVVPATAVAPEPERTPYSREPDGTTRPAIDTGMRGGLRDVCARDSWCSECAVESAETYPRPVACPHGGGWRFLGGRQFRRDAAGPLLPAPVMCRCGACGCRTCRSLGGACGTCYAPLPKVQP